MLDVGPGGSACTSQSGNTSLPVAAAPSDADTWRVAPDGSGDATSIQAGLDLAASGDSVLVAPGTYVESVGLPSSVALIGEGGAAATVLQSADTQLCVGGFGLAQNLIQGLTLTGVAHATYAWSGMAAVMFEGELEVRDCVVANNGAAHGAITGEGDLRVVDTVFSDNQGGTDAADVGSIRFGQGTLHVERCVFERQPYGLIRTASTEFVFRNSVVRENDSAVLLVQTLVADPVHAVVEGNLFLDNGGVPIDEQLWIPNPSITMEVRGNTFVRSSLDVTLGAGWILENNVLFGADRGVKVWGTDPGYVVRCNNAWGNGQNWEGIPDPTGMDGNLSVDPLFCDAAAEVFTLAANSVCLPANNACGARMGAHGVGCGPQSIEAASWGRIKAWHR